MKCRQVVRLLVITCVCVCFTSYVFSQDRSNPKETFQEAESFFLYEEFTDALPLYAKLKVNLPNNYNLDYKIGRCYLNIPYEKERAIEYLENATKHMTAASKEASLKEVNAPLDALFYLGDAYRINNQLEKAIQTYQEFKTHSTDVVYDFSLVDHQIAACQRALVMEKNPVDMKSINLGNVINSRFSETNPVVTPDETMIVYAARLPFYQALFYSRKVNGVWTASVNMIPELGIDGDCFPTSISPDGTELYLYRSDSFLGDLYVTNFKNGKWTKIRKLNDNINTKYWESHACISPDGKTLYFTSNRKGGYGGLDIYKTTRLSTSNDNWGVAENLGPVINSKYNDDTPFITEDGKRMYFSSFGHETMGGFDIFYSDMKSDGTWGKPVNMGYPINTTDDELFFQPIKDGSIAYTSKCQSKNFGRFDIYRYEIKLEKPVQMCTVKGTIKLSAATTLYIKVYSVTKKDTLLKLTSSTGDFSFEALPGNYELHLDCKGCQSQVIPFTVDKNTKELKDISAVMQSAVRNTTTLTDISKVEVADAANKADDSRTGKDITLGIESSKDTVALVDSVKNTTTKTQTSGVVKKSDRESVSTRNLWTTRLVVSISGILAMALVWLILIIMRRRKNENKTT